MSTEARPAGLLTGAERRDILRDSLALVSSSQLATVCGAVTSLILRAAVEPALFGIWSTMRTLLEYGNYSSLGINRSARRNIAVAVGQGDACQPRHIANVAMTIELLAGAAVALGLVAAGAIQASRGSAHWAAAFCFAAVIAVVGRYQAFNLVVLHSHKQFTVVARARVFGAVMEMVLIGAAGYCFGYYGLVASAALAQSINACYVRFAGGLRFDAVHDRGVALGLLIAGWPIAAEALALTALRSVDRLVIVTLLPDGARQLGWYSVAIVLGSWAFDQSNLVANVIYPRLAEMLGRTCDRSAVLRMGLRSAELIALAMVPCAALLLTAGVATLHRFLPAYRPGLISAGGLVAAAAMLGVSVPLRYSLITVGRTTKMLLATGFSAGMSLFGSLWWLRMGGQANGDDLRPISWTSASAAILCLGLMLLLCVAGHRELWSVAGRVVLAAGYCIAGAAVFSDIWNGGILVWALLAVWCLCPVWLLIQQVNWSDLLRRRGGPTSGSETLEG